MLKPLLDQLHISDVAYAIDEVKMLHNPVKTIQMSRVTNNDCQSVVKKVTLSKTTRKEDTWNSDFSLMVGGKETITAGIPLIFKGQVDVGMELTLRFSKGSTIVEEVKNSMSVELKVPPNHSCTARMEGRKMTADIPYMARLTRTYRNRETRWTSISGKYNGVQIGEVRAVIDRCQPVPDAKPCP